MSSEGTFNILMVEDDKSISSVVKSALEARGNVVNVINNGAKAIEHLNSLKEQTYDITLLDLNLPGATGWEILARIKSLDTFNKMPVLMLTGVDDDFSESRALLDGADDYIVKPCSMKVLMARIESNTRKQESSPALDIDLPYTDGEFEEISNREKEILQYLVKGYSNKEIAKLTFISESTVINHVHNLFKKLHVNTRLQAAVVALKYNLI